MKLISDVDTEGVEVFNETYIKFKMLIFLLRTVSFLRVAYEFNFFDSVLPLLSFYMTILACKKCLLPEKSSDKECVKHRERTYTRCRVFEVKKNLRWVQTF